jgi:5-methyltetrahydropteroyltriglutamate--homocysteine methyltransferase
MAYIQATHVGSLIRPETLVGFQIAHERGEPVDEGDYEATLRTEVANVVARQVQAGIDVPSDGEFGKSSWINYLYERISGLEQREGPVDLPPSRDRQAFPGFYAEHDAELRRSIAENPSGRTPPPPTMSVCTGPITYDRTALDRDISNFKAALEGRDVADAFLPVVAPASTYWLENEFYGTEEEFVYALADALAVEYRAIVDAGLMLQVDDAVLMHECDSILSEGGTIEDYRRWAQLRVDALNHALSGIPE